jgi:PEP-CTERM motif
MMKDLILFPLPSLRRTVIPALRLSVIGAVVFLHAAGRGQAGLLTLDQSFDASGNTAVVVDDQSVASQTFTVGQSGLLSQVDLQVQWFGNPTDNLVLTILGTSGGLPDSSNVLGSVSIPNTSVYPTFDLSRPDFLNVDVSGLGISVASGDALVLELSYPSGTGSYFWLLSLSSPGYAGGTAFVRFPPNPDWLAASAYDAGFQTWVDQTAAVPEPSSLMLLGIGCCGLCRFTRKRKRHKA